MTTATTHRYDAVVIALHWVMAVAVLLMLGSGLTMRYIELPQSLLFNLYQWHKSLGVLLLLAFFLRLGWRLTHTPPALPASIVGLEALAAKGGHWALYAVMILLPLSGWVMVSASVYGLPTIVFGWFEWPHIPGIAANTAISDVSKTVHWWLAVAMMLLLTGHVGAVLKHAVIDEENIFSRMWWGKRS